MVRGRLRRHRPKEGEAAAPEDEYIEIDPSELTGIFSVPQWLRDIGLMAWLLVGIGLFLVAAVWLASLTSVIGVPVIVAAVVAAVGSPAIAWMARHRVPRPLGAALLMLLLVLVATGSMVLVLAGISQELSSIKGQ